MAAAADQSEEKKELRLEEILEQNGHSVGWLVETLKNNEPKFAVLCSSGEIKEYGVRKIGEGKGYCSHVFRVSFRFDGDAGAADYSLVLKIPTIDQWVAAHKGLGRTIDEAKLKRFERTIRETHEAECDVLEFLHDLHATGFPIPAVYAMERRTDEQPGIFLMQDASINAHSPDIYDSMSAELCENFVRHIADFQTFVELKPAELWQDRFSKSHYVERFKKDSKTDMPGVSAVFTIPNEKNEVMDQYALLDMYEFSKFTIIDCSEAIGASTLNHSDAWTNNLLVKENSPNEISAFLDWAIMSKCNPLFDIACFIGWCAEAEVRRAHEERLLDVFHERLTENLRAHGRKPRFSREQATELYELAFVHVVCTFIEIFTFQALPLLQQEENAEDKKKAEHLLQRLRAALEDAGRLLKKHEIVERFGRKKTEEGEKPAE
ncbi:hypothetical protein M3Y99_00680300 [Aphelenchoides fujianensis]|nr:hypothetical protein M3Y99_00680300 [Aphelenchoides fujianensis]